MKCLLVDDEPGIREGLAALLRLRGHEVRTAADCATALALLQEHEFELVLTDWRLPDGTGERLYAAGTAPIVAISGYPDEVTASPRLCAVLSKPVAPDRLFALVAERAAAGGARGPAAASTLPADVQAVLARALELLGEASGRAEVVDDGAFVTLRAAWPGDAAEPEFAELGGDLRVLQPAGEPEPRLELRWCRDGRPDVDRRAIRPDAAWPATGPIAVDFDGREVPVEHLVRLLDRAAAARRCGQTVHFLNLPATLRDEAVRLGRTGDVPAPARIGPRVPELLAELWR